VWRLAAGRDRIYLDGSGGVHVHRLELANTDVN
jgi:hypothetical protein